MKKYLTLLMLLLLTGCATTTLKRTTTTNTNITTKTTTTSKTVSIMKKIWLDSYNDTNNTFKTSDLTNIKLNINNSYKDDLGYTINNRKDDAKYEFYFSNKMRFVNLSDGYIFTIPNNEVNIDYSLSKYRVQFSFDDSILSISNEYSNPYGDSLHSWHTYLTEWLNRYVANDQYLIDNNLSHTRENGIITDMINGYEILTYSILINDNENIDKPYYNIGVIRKNKEYEKFVLLVMKSESEHNELFDEILSSYKTVSKKGRVNIHVGNLELKNNPLWNDETKNYFDLLNDTSNFDFGFFSYSMQDKESDTYDTQFTKIENEENRLQGLFDYTNDIIPTYSHLAWYNNVMYFPLEMANYFGGGNGFNNKKVLQFTFQFTINNNNVNIYNEEYNYTPMFDILRGNYDEYFRKLARDIKEYEKPVLFRLNNEMNTDWTSYSGIMSLLDPDIFRETWIRVYNIFNEEKVDNCIWIFNPIAKSCPYSNWGEDMCYFPGVDYVQALGITYYEMNNTSQVDFRTCYGGEIYTKNKDTFSNYPWIISEFACGSGGETSGTLYRNQSFQAQWVRDLFDVASNKEDPENEFFKKIAAAIWFNCNDIDSDNRIYNALKIDNSLKETIKAFKEGLAKIKR